jgi:transposase
MRTPWRTRVGPAPIGPPIDVDRTPRDTRARRRPRGRRAHPRRVDHSDPVARAAEGCRLRPGAPETFFTRLEELALQPALMTVIAPLVELLGPIDKQIAALDDELARLVPADEVLRHLTTVPGVGPVTAAAFVATVDDVTRFRGAHQVEAYLGWCPANGARARSSAAATSPRRGMAACAGSWSRRRGACCAGGRDPRPRRGAPGRIG